MDRGLHDTIDIPARFYTSEKNHLLSPGGDVRTLDANMKDFSFTSEQDEPWEYCYDKTKQFDHDLCNGWKDQVDKLLVFAGLLAATVTPFAVDSYKNLREKPEVKTNWILEQVLLEIHNANTGTTGQLPSSPSFTPSAQNVRLNVILFMSLCLSLSTVLIGILCSQWLREYQRYMRLSPKDGIAVRQLRIEGLYAWKLPNILLSLPFLLQLSLILFFFGVLDLLWTLHTVVAAIMTVVVGLVMIFIIITTLLPSFQLFLENDHRSTRCPYKTPQAWALYRLIARLLRFFNIHMERTRSYLKAKTWVDTDNAWHKWKKERDPLDFTYNDTVSGLVWLDENHAKSSKMILSIHHCIKDLEPAEGAEVVSRIKNHIVEEHRVETDPRPETVHRRELNSVLYLGEKSQVQVLPQVYRHYLDSVVQLLNAPVIHHPVEEKATPNAPGSSIPAINSQDFVSQFLQCAKVLIPFMSPNEEDINTLWKIIKLIITREPPIRNAAHVKLACDIIFDLDRTGKEGPVLAGALQSLEPNSWCSHVSNIFQGYDHNSLEPCCREVLRLRDQRCGHSAAVVVPDGNSSA